MVPDQAKVNLVQVGNVVEALNRIVVVVIRPWPQRQIFSRIDLILVSWLDGITWPVFVDDLISNSLIGAILTHELQFFNVFIVFVLIILTQKLQNVKVLLF